MSVGSDNGKILKIDDVVEIRRVLPAASGPSVVKKEQAIIQTVGCDKIVMKTSYRGPQGPKGETASFNDLEIPSLTNRFLAGLI